MTARFNINKIGISVVNIESTVETIKKALSDDELNYICVTNSRTCYIANHNIEYCDIQNRSLLTLPDGMPLVWIARLNGHTSVRRVSGADLLKAILNESSKNGFSHYFFGSKPHTIKLIAEKLRKEYGDIDIRGTESPPFQSIEKFDISEIANTINHLKPTFFWCGLGAPKQEILISLLQPKLNATICIGVGLAFDYYGGTVKRAPKWMRESGLEGLYRLIQQPGRVNLKTFRALSYIVPFLIKALIRRIFSQVRK